MTFRTGLLALANSIRKGVPAGLDLRQQNKLTIIVRQWNGTRKRGAGSYTDLSRLELVERPRIEQVSTREIASGRGLYEEGDIKVKHITPSNGAGVGYTVAQIAPVAPNQLAEVIYQLEGPHQGWYRRIEARTTSDVSWHLVLRRTEDIPTVSE